MAISLRDKTQLRTHLTLAEVAARIGVSERMVKQLVASGSLPAIKIGRTTRVSVAELEQWLCSRPRAGRPSPDAA